MKRLQGLDFIKINLFWLVINIRNNAVGVVFMPFLVDAFVNPESKNTALGEMRTAGLVIAMLVQPAMGLLSDRSSSRFGRRRPFLLVGLLFDLLFLALIANAHSYWALFAAILLIQFSSNTSHGALQGLIPDLVPEDQRGTASGYKGVMELLPLILVALLVAGMVGAGQFTRAVWLTGALMLGFALLSLAAVRETPLAAAPQTSLKPAMLRVLGMLAGIAAGGALGLALGGAFGGLIWLALLPLAGAQTARIAAFSLGGLVAMAAAVGAGTWAGVAATLGVSALRSQRSFVWWVANRLLFFTSITSIQVFAPYFLMNAFAIDRQQATSMTGQLMTVVGLCTLASALPSGWLCDRWGARRVVFWSGLMAAAGAGLLLGMVWLPGQALLYAAGCTLGIAAGLFTTANWAMGTALVPSGEAGRFLGISNLAGAGAGMIGTGMGGPIADVLNRSTPGLGYTVLFAIFVVLLLLSAAVLRGAVAPKPGAPA